MPKLLLAAFAALVVSGCSSSPPPPELPDVAGTWARKTNRGDETLVLAVDGTFRFDGPPPAAGGLGADIYHVSGTYTIGAPDPHFAADELMFSLGRSDDHFLDQTMLLQGSSADGSRVDARFTYAIDGDTFVRGATVQDRDYPDHWVGVEVTVIDHSVADSEVLSWMIDQYADQRMDFVVQYGPYITWDLTDSWSGSWTQVGDETRLVWDVDLGLTQIAVGAGARRDKVEEADGAWSEGLAPQLAAYGVTYTRVVQTP